MKTVPRGLAALALVVLFGACAPVALGGIAGALTVAGQAFDLAADAAPAVKAAVKAVKSKDGIRDKLAEFRARYCAEADLRAQSRQVLAEALTSAGVPEEEAAVHAAQAKALGSRICPGAGHG